MLATGASSRRALSRGQLYPPHLVPSYSTLHLEKLQAFLVLVPGLGVGIGILAVSLSPGPHSWVTP